MPDKESPPTEKGFIMTFLNKLQTMPWQFWLVVIIIAVGASGSYIIRGGVNFGFREKMETAISKADKHIVKENKHAVLQNEYNNNLAKTIQGLVNSKATKLSPDEKDDLNDKILNMLKITQQQNKTILKSTTGQKHGLLAIDDEIALGKKYVKRKNGTKYIMAMTVTDEFIFTPECPYPGTDHDNRPKNNIEVSLNELYLNLVFIKKELYTMGHDLNELEPFVTDLQDNLENFISAYKKKISNILEDKKIESVSIPQKITSAGLNTPFYAPLGILLSFFLLFNIIILISKYRKKRENR